jgi:hypothetical protein
MIIIGVDIETANLHGAICEFSAVGLELETGAELFVVTSLVDPGDVDWDHLFGKHGVRCSQPEARLACS